MTGDIASELVAGADRFLLKQIEESAAKREKLLEAGFLLAGSLSGFGRAQPQAAGAHSGGAGCSGAGREAVDTRLIWWTVGRTSVRSPIAIIRIQSVTWSAFGDVTGEGLELDPESRSDRSCLRRHRDPGRGPDARAARRAWPTACRPNRRWRAGWPRTATT